MAFTVIPLHNIALPPGTSIPFANGFTFQDLPEWVRSEGFLEYLSHHDRESVLQAQHAFVAEYAASNIGDPDPSWQGPKQKSIQDTKMQEGIFANLAAWLRQPSSLCYTVMFHGLHWDIAGEPEKQPIIQRSDSHTPIYCHPKDAGNPLIAQHLIKAAELHKTLCSIPRDNPVWLAVRALWAGLTMYAEDIRYSLFWIGLESLFGADQDSGEISYKLAQRISFFLADNPSDARDLFRKVKKCYGLRSKIVHGRWKDTPDTTPAMADTEAILRTVIRHLLQNQQMLQTFISKHRDKFLEDWVFSRATEPPPFP
jgi:hypothetical protein